MTEVTTLLETENNRATGCQGKREKPCCSDNNCCSDLVMSEPSSSLSMTTKMLGEESAKRRLDFTALQENSDIRRKELRLLINYAIVPDSSFHNNASSRPAVWIEADAGVGKSCLLQQFRSEIKASFSQRAITISGRFESRAAASEPYAALRECIKDFVQNWLLLPENDVFREGWASGLRTQGNANGAFDLLLSILPELRSLYSSQTEKECSPPFNGKGDSSPSPFGNFKSREYRFEQFRVAFRKMIRFTCRQLWNAEHKRSLVIILDDFHWVDPDSMQIIKTLMVDPNKPHNFRIVAATRPLDDFSNVLNLYNILTVPTVATSDLQTAFQTDSIKCRRTSAFCRLMESSRQASFATKTTQPSTNQNQEGHQVIDDGSQSERSEKTKYKRIPNLELMELSRLSTSQIVDLLHALLFIRQPIHDEESTTNGMELHDLARVIKLKTHGNSFVVVQFLRFLEREGHFFYDDQHLRWRFNVENISKVDYQSENVSKVVTRTLEMGSTRRKSALMVAASFGVSQFDVPTIVHASRVVDAEGESSKSSGCDNIGDPMIIKKRVDYMNAQMSEALADGFVEKTGSGRYRFAHDRIRESAYSLLPEGIARKEVHLKVGRQLRFWMDTQEEFGLSQSGLSEELLLLHTTKQLNTGSELITDSWELKDLADLNYQAAELAARKTSFFPAVEYLQIGLDLLGENGWVEQYDRTLRFHIDLARMQYSCGLLEDCWKTSEAVVENGKSFEDTEQIYRTRVLCLLQNDLLSDALIVVLEVLDMIGEPVPKKFIMVHILRGVMKARSFLKQTPDEKLLNLPIVHDKHLETLCDFYEILVEISFILGRSDYLLYVGFRNISMIAERGKYPRSFLAIQFWACYFKTHMGDFVDAMRYGMLANKLADRQKCIIPGSVARSDEMFYGHVHHWFHPYRESLSNNQDAFQRLWDCGFIDTALVDSATLLQHLFVAGEPLQKVCEACSNYSEAYIDYQQLTHWYTNASQYQAVLNLSGDSHDNPGVLCGKVMDSNSVNKLKEKSLSPLAYYYYQFWSLLLSFHFRDLENAKQHIKAMQGDPIGDISNFLAPLRYLYTGLSYFHLYQRHGKSSYCRRAVAALRILQTWANRGAINCVYMCELLEAEHHASNGRIDAAMTFFKKAIKSTSDLDLIHHIALANQLAGVCLVQNGRKKASKSYLVEAITRYEQWGAVAIVNELRFRYDGWIQ